VLNKCDKPPPEVAAPWEKTKAEEEASEEMALDDDEEEFEGAALFN